MLSVGAFLLWTEVIVMFGNGAWTGGIGGVPGICCAMGCLGAPVDTFDMASEVTVGVPLA